MEDLKGSVRIQKMNLDKSFIRTGRNGKTRYFRSYIQQMEHDFRIEEMDDNYLKRPNEENKYHKFLDIDYPTIFNEWEDIKKLHKKEKGKSIQHQTKEAINFLFSFSEGFDLPEEDREYQFKIVKQFIQEYFDYPVYVTQHNDEKSLHYGATILNFDKKTMRPISKQIDTSYLQDIFFGYLKKHNADYGHRRGDPKEVTGAENKSILESKIEDLKNENEELRRKNEELKNIENETFEMIFELVSKLYELGINYKGKSIQELVKQFQKYFLNEEKFEKLLNKVIKLAEKKGLDISSFHRVEFSQLVKELREKKKGLKSDKNKDTSNEK